MGKARKAQQDWAKLPIGERVHTLRPLRHAIAQRADEILRLLREEVGKVPMDGLAGDLLVTLEQLRYYERHAAEVLRPRRRGKPWLFFEGARFVETWEPHGVALVIAPWNYPLQLAVVPMATALFAGNAVLLKCSERTPRTASLIESLCRDAGLPDGLVQVSCEPAEEASALLDAKPDIVFFTGSSGNGRSIAQRCAALLIPTVMELGGKDPALIFDSCDMERTVNGVTYGSFLNAGQVCVGIKRIYVQRSIHDRFLHAFIARVQELRRDASDESDLGSVCFEPVRLRLQRQIEEALARGARLHTEWRRDSAAMTPAVLTEVPADAGLMIEESFGPVVCIEPFEDEADAIRRANASDFALSASIWTGNRTQGERVSSQLRCGTCAVNDVIRNIGNPEAAFGGNGRSGYGRYHGVEGLRAFSRVKTVMTAGKLHKVEIHWFPFRARTFARLRAVLTLRHGSGSIAKRLKDFLKMSMLILPLVCGVCLGEADSDGSLQLDVALPPHAHGQIAYLVLAKPGGFPDRRENALFHGFVPVAPVDAATQHLDLGSVQPGRYAVSVYLDLNGNGKLDKNWLGIPKEPVGASDNPGNHMRPPRFEECAFMHGENPQTISITLVH
jgi:acyl-CoA reductase-like NAD-dependent aldehyde dehydrogenase/uncharacterized protein (DUF2141 family)